VPAFLGFGRQRNCAIFLSLFAKTKGSDGRDALPKQSRQGATEHRLSWPDGSELRVECYGKEDASPIILTHGWGANSKEWDYLKTKLAGDFQLIFWNLPGLGRSMRPTNRYYSMEN
jgi:pimeloyl-ACP methyl ester carboxylesterase